MLREPIYTALFQLGATASLLDATGKPLVPAVVPWRFTSRRWQHWDSVTGESQPALFLTELEEINKEQRVGMPQKWHCRVEFVIYAQNADVSLSVTPVLHPLVDALEQAVRGDPLQGGKQTLGNLVYHVIPEEVRYYEGKLGIQAIAVMPVRVEESSPQGL